MSDLSPSSDQQSVADRVVWEPTNCPLCGAAESRKLLTTSDLLYGFPGEFTLVRCVGCSHVFMNPRPNRATIKWCYPANYAPFQDGGIEGHSSASAENAASARTSCWTSPRTWNWLRRLVLWWIDSRAAPIPDKPHEHSLALELGCAHGSFLVQLQDRGWDCVGVEPSVDASNRATAKGLDVRVGSLEEMDFPLEHFDAVFAWMVVEHLHDPVCTLRHIRGLLKPDGRLYFSVPNFGCWERHLFGRLRYSLSDVTHLHQFTPATLRRLLETCGFELVELIHQRNVNNLVGTAGFLLKKLFPRWSLGERLVRWIDSPTALGLCLLNPLARFLAAIRQGGRLTIVARRR